jgi:transcriptional regulator with GAF, ATPase, and Fis domain
VSGDQTLRLTQRNAREASIRGVRLTVASGPDAGRVFDSTSDRLVVGSAETADLVLHDDAVSRFQCEITVADGRVLLKDLESRNGTFVEHVRIIAAELVNGSRLTLGQTELRFELKPDVVGVPLADGGSFGSMVGSSIVMRRVFSLLARAAASDATVLIVGETGTGKEVAAESIHRESTRRRSPFVVCDCSAIPSELLEAELFGHEKGAFTGAHQARQGLFEIAQGGTLFLDEIGELSLTLQPKLLRALERKEVRRVGGNDYHTVDVRVVAATNRDLKAEVNQRRFRSDLYYRLAVLEITLPPLRDRPDDLPALLEHLLAAAGATDAIRHDLTAPDFLTELSRHGWPGNVRELRNYVERCLVLHEAAPLAEDGSATSDRLPDTTLPLKQARDRWTRLLERRYCDAVLAANDGNVAAAARAAGVDRMYFYRLLWRHGLR